MFLPTVEKNVPPPEENPKSKASDFFKNLVAGDSFGCDHSLYNACKQYFHRNKHLGLRVIMRRENESIRVWVLKREDDEK